MQDNQQGSLQQKAGKRPYRRHGKDPKHPDFPHGLFAGWKAGCRCERCVEANKRYRRENLRRYRINNPAYLLADRIYKSDYRKTIQGRKNTAKCDLRKYQETKAKRYDPLMQAIYAACPEGYHVDHIIARSKGGKHEPDNLQYLPALLNKQKSARLDFDCGDAALSWRLFVKEPPTTRAAARRTKRSETRGISEN